MKANKLITELQKAVAQFGDDLEIVCDRTEDGSGGNSEPMISYLEFCVKHDGKVREIII